MSKTFDLTNERKLTDQDVLVIRAVHIPRSPRFGSVMLAQLFGVSQPTIDRVVKRQTYRHLHPLLLPGSEVYGAGYIGLADASARFGEWARTKTEYKLACVEVRDNFATGGYAVSGKFDEPKILGKYAYAARPVRRVIDPEVERQRRAKLRFARLRQIFGDDFDEQIGLAAAGLGPRLPLDEFRTRLGKPAPRERTQAELDQERTSVLAKLRPNLKK
ncbi:hypothetical protein AB1286_19905 [Trinickia sp. NRRL B-1857]|uniref:hypothetical protein n=1 Tax=Trinickia sp. NRRL B-1857 TaxID=3162879 RepID=UPI003D2905BA